MRIRRVYIKKAGGEIASEPCYTAWRGFSHLGYPLDFFEWDDLRDKCLPLDRLTVVVGGTITVHMALRQIGVPPPAPLNIPSSLLPFAGRRIWETTLGDLRRIAISEPKFVKPLTETKSFPGSVIARPTTLSACDILTTICPCKKRNRWNSLRNGAIMCIAAPLSELHTTREIGRSYPIAASCGER